MVFFIFVVRDNYRVVSLLLIGKVELRFCYSFCILNIESFGVRCGCNLGLYRVVVFVFYLEKWVI